jgi:peptidoglycan/xylan/chitin deacetylase (PgdA/CDA1 family)
MTLAQFPWPNGYRCAVALTFDEDGECVPRFYDPENAARRLSLQSEATYGPNVGSPRILDLLERHDIPASFFAPGYTAERHPDLMREIVARGHELGHHGYLHERPDFVDEDEEERIMVRGLEVLEAITGRRPRGYRSPAWELKPTSPALIKKYGFLYDSSLMGDDEPYLIDAGAEKLLEIPIQWINDDWAYFGFCSIPALGNGISSPQAVFETWSEEFAGYYEVGGCYVLTMHPFVIGRPSRIRLLDRLIQYMQGFDGVWFATLEQIANHALSTGLVRYRPYADMTITSRP